MLPTTSATQQQLRAGGGWRQQQRPRKQQQRAAAGAAARRPRRRRQSRTSRNSRALQVREEVAGAFGLATHCQAQLLPQTYVLLGRPADGAPLTMCMLASFVTRMCVTRVCVCPSCHYLPVAADVLDMEQPEMAIDVPHLQYWANNGEFTKVCVCAGLSSCCRAATTSTQNHVCAASCTRLCCCNLLCCTLSVTSSVLWYCAGVSC